MTLKFAALLLTTSRLSRRRSISAPPAQVCGFHHYLKGHAPDDLIFHGTVDLTPGRF